MRLLIVEDNHNLRQTYTENLPYLGHTAIAVPSAEEALERTTRETFDAILLDNNLGEGRMTGLEAADLLSKRAPVYLMSIQTIQPDAVSSSGARGFIRKSDPRTFYDELEGLLAQLPD